MSSALSFEDLNKFSRDLMRKEGFEKFDLNVEGRSGKGENYVGEVTFFTLTPEPNKIYSLVMKTAKKSKNITEKIPFRCAYRRELFMYSEIFPTFRKFLEEFNVSEKHLDYYPKIYWVCEEESRETIIMENMKTKGFDVLNRMQPVKRHQAVSVVEKLGKHHAFSLALRKLRPDVFDSLAKNLDNVWKEIFEAMNLYEFFIGLFRNVMDWFKSDENFELVEKFENFEDDIKSIFDGLSPDPLVICHGDCWINNILFKSKNNSTSEICLVDFQLSTLDSPIKDLSYFMYTACDKKDLEDLDVLLGNYLKSLSETLGLFGLKSDAFFTLEKLREQWRYCGKFGLIMSLMLIKFELFHGAEAPDVSEEGFDVMNLVNIKMENEQIYKRRIIDVFTHFAQTFL